MADERERPQQDTATPTDEESEAVRFLRSAHPDALLDVVRAFGEETVVIRREHNHAVLQSLRDAPSLRFDYLVDVTAVDRLYLDEDIRFAVVYHLYSHPHNRRLRVKAPVPEADCHIASVVSLWPTANWLEREVYDMYGIVFDDHPDLRRILMPDDYGSYPLRKDYPLHGKGERDRFVF